MLRSLVALLLLATLAISTNFDWEKIQLSRNETAGYPDIAFGEASSANATYTGPKCKIGPGDPGWPTVEEWNRFNATLGGALLRPVPPSAVCYSGQLYNAAACEFISNSSTRSRMFLDHPAATLTEWSGGNTCIAGLNVTGRKCEQGAYPVYVINATTVRHIQLGINFARNRNLRLVVKWVSLTTTSIYW